MYVLSYLDSHTYVSSHIGLPRSTSLFTTRRRLHSFYLSEGPRSRNHAKEVVLWCSRFTLFTVLLIILSIFKLLSCRGLGKKGFFPIPEDGPRRSLGIRSVV